LPNNGCVCHNIYIYIFSTITDPINAAADKVFNFKYKNVDINKNNNNSQNSVALDGNPEPNIGNISQ
jgi:hypothetical protein